MTELEAENSGTAERGISILAWISSWLMKIGGREGFDLASRDQNFFPDS